MQERGGVANTADMVTSEKHNMPNPGSIPTFAVGFLDEMRVLAPGVD